MHLYVIPMYDLGTPHYSPYNSDIVLIFRKHNSKFTDCARAYVTLSTYITHHCVLYITHQVIIIINKHLIIYIKRNFNRPARIASVHYKIVGIFIRWFT